MNFTVTYQGRLISDAPDEQIEACLTRVMDGLVTLGVDDPSVGATLGTRQVEISLFLEAATLEEALNQGAATIRAAIHAAGGGTPEWDVHWIKAEAEQALVGSTG